MQRVRRSIIFIICALMLSACHSGDGTAESSDMFQHRTESSEITENANQGFGKVNLSGFSDNLTNVEYVDSYGTYTFTKLPDLPDDGSYNIQSAILDGEYIRFAGSFKQPEDYRTRTFTVDESLHADNFEGYTIPTFEEKGTIGTTRICSDGTMLFTTRRYLTDTQSTDEVYGIYHCTKDGTILSKNELPGTGKNDTMQVLPDGGVMVLCSGRICIFDKDLNMVSEI